MISLTAQGAQSIIAFYDKLRVNIQKERNILLSHIPLPSFSFQALLNSNPFPGARLAVNYLPLGQGEKPCLLFPFDAHLISSFSKVMGGYGKRLELDGMENRGERVKNSPWLQRGPCTSDF